MYSDCRSNGGDANRTTEYIIIMYTRRTYSRTARTRRRACACVRRARAFVITDVRATREKKDETKKNKKNTTSRITKRPSRRPTNTGRSVGSRRDRRRIDDHQAAPTYSRRRRKTVRKKKTIFVLLLRVRFDEPYKSDQVNSPELANRYDRSVVIPSADESDSRFDREGRRAKMST